MHPRVESFEEWLHSLVIGYNTKINDEAISEKITFETNDEVPLEEITVDEPCSIEELFQSSHSEYINDKEK